jgi:hypothetical protein
MVAIRVPLGAARRPQMTNVTVSQKTMATYLEVASYLLGSCSSFIVFLNMRRDSSFWFLFSDYETDGNPSPPDNHLDA